MDGQMRIPYPTYYSNILDAACSLKLLLLHRCKYIGAKLVVESTRRAEERPGGFGDDTAVTESPRGASDGGVPALDREEEGVQQL